MKTELERYSQDNARLNEQIKLLVQTEKQLLKIKRQTQSQLERIESLNSFSLDCTGIYNPDIILQKALILLKQIYPFFSGYAFLYDQELKSMTCQQSILEDPIRVSFIKDLSNRSLSFNWFEPKLYTEYGQDSSAFVSTMMHLLKKAGFDFEQWDLCIKANRPSLLLPFFAQDEEAQHGFLLVFQNAGMHFSYHDRLPGSRDKPFINLIQGHIEKALKNAHLNAQLEASAKLLEHRVSERTAQLAKANQKLEQSLINVQEMQSELFEASRKAGFSEIATNVLHNVGNVLNSLNISAQSIHEQIASLAVDKLARISSHLNSKSSDEIRHLFSEQSQSDAILKLISQVTSLLETQRGKLKDEITEASRSIEHIKQIIGAQQYLAKKGGLAEACSINEVIKNAISLCFPLKTTSQNIIDCKLSDIPRTYIDRHNVLQILVNLIKNADQACALKSGGIKKIWIRSSINHEGHIEICVADNGIGIEKDQFIKIFQQGFSTKKDGHGFGLHGSANAAKEMGGNIHCHSDGHEKGARFTLVLPFKTADTISANGVYDEKSPQAF